MQIAIDCRCVHQYMGGIGRAALSLIRALAKCNCAHAFTLISSRGSLIDVDAFEHVQADAAMIDERFEQLGLPGLLSELKIDLYVNPTFALPALKTTKFQIAYVHDVVFEDHPDWVEPGLRSYLCRWSRFSAEHADKVITVSDHARERIIDVYGMKEERLVRIHNGGVDPAFNPPSPEAAANARRKHDIQGSYLLYVGGLERKKGILELLSAFGRLVKDGFEGGLVLMGGEGGGPAFNFAAALRESGCADRVKCLGYQPECDKWALIAGSALFVYPSHYEGFGLPPLEAMRLGIPCVTSNATAIPEIVGDVALTVDVNDIELFSRALRHGLDNAEFRNRAQTEGPRRASRFSWDCAAREFLSVCGSLER